MERKKVLCILGRGNDDRSLGKLPADNDVV
jgi:hypothetical protein